MWRPAPHLCSTEEADSNPTPTKSVGAISSEDPIRTIRSGVDQSSTEEACGAVGPDNQDRVSPPHSRRPSSSGILAPFSPHTASV
eukprot:1450668-Rhodomonas_salina.1